LVRQVSIKRVRPTSARIKSSEARVDLDVFVWHLRLVVHPKKQLKLRLGLVVFIASNMQKLPLEI